MQDKPIPNLSATPGRYHTLERGQKLQVEGERDKLTGSTANFVTASSPVSFRHTFPSGTLFNESAGRTSQNDGGINTIGPLEHSALIPEAFE